MVSVSLHFRKFTAIIPFPENWNELTTDQLRYCLAAQTSKYSKQKIFYYLLVSNAKAAKIKLPQNWEAKLNLEQASAASLTAINFLYDANSLTRFPFPTLNFGWLKQYRFTGQEDRFKSLTVHQLEECFILVELFRNAQEARHLQKLASVLFLKKSILPWAKQPEFNLKTAEKNSKLFKHCPVDVLLCVYAWVCGCIAELPLYFPEIFPQPEATQNQEPKPFDFQAFAKCIHGSAGPRNGLRSDIRKQPALEFLFDINLQAIEARKQNEEAKRNSN